MKEHVIATILVCMSSLSLCQGQDNKAFAAFSRTTDSLMNIASYDKNTAACKQQVNEYIAAYNKLSAKDKNDFKGDLQDKNYNLACAYAKAGDKKDALDYLYLSKFYDYEHLRKDEDMDNLRQEPRFIAYMNIAKHQKNKYQLTLQNAVAYNTAEKDNLPAFTYQSTADTNLAALKTAFNLDSIAGYGDDVARIINLMEWVHGLIPHDGSKGNPAIKNAMSLITECKRDKKNTELPGDGYSAE